MGVKIKSQNPGTLSVISNHYTSALSTLDMEMVRAIPSGGNWKDIPLTIPSRRLQQIRESYANGEGSRSTYYGRLKPDDPAYTISTYFNRPGNGCFIHYDVAGEQQRLISQREGARLQSFPDSFRFSGSRASVYKQIGNAVPPLLAYQIAQTLPKPGVFVDLFCGAGGLSLGFHWAGWRSIVANDFDKSFLETQAINFGVPTVLGDLSEESVIEQVVSIASLAKRNEKEPCYVLGGPPCQGFSTAGNTRSMADKRNHLFKAYAEVLRRLEPEGFVFENVPGLLSMEKGAIFELVKKTLSDVGYHLNVWTLSSENYGVPQRRKRVIIIGTKDKCHINPPPPTSYFDYRVQALFALELPIVSGTKNALADLPELVPGEDGSDKAYRHKPMTEYQRFARGEITAAELIQKRG